MTAEIRHLPIQAALLALAVLLNALTAACQAPAPTAERQDIPAAPAAAAMITPTVWPTLFAPLPTGAPMPAPTRITAPEATDGPTAPGPTSQPAAPNVRMAPVETPSRPPATSTPAPKPAPTAALRLATPDPDYVPAATRTPTPPPSRPAVDHRRLALQAIYNLPWMDDGATPQERETADRIEALTRYNSALSLRIVSMPFLKSHQITDTGVVSALTHLSYRDRDAADRLLAHPTLEKGIDDANTVPLTLAYGEWLFGSNHLRLLEPTAVAWHTHEADLPLSGTAAITIATERSSRLSPETAAQVEEDLAWIENYLQQPLPTHNVLIHYGSGLRSPIKGANVQASIMQPSSHHKPSSYHWVQHELMHYWFHSNEGWLDEGMAQVLTSLLNANGEPEMLPVTAPSCPSSARIRDLEPGGTETAVGSRCLYAVGERFFSTLYQEAGYDAFQDGARKLAARTDRPPFRDMGLDEVKDAFSASPNALAAAMDKWH